MTEHPLSVQQARILRETAVTMPGAHDVVVGIDIEGAISVPTLDAALTAVVRRHQTLRVEVSPGSESRQRVQPARSTYLEERVLAPDDDIPPLAPLELSAGDTLRIFLFSRDVTNHTLVLQAHHLICDEWSLVTMWAEVVESYGRLLAGAGAVEEPLEPDYFDYVSWQAEAARSQRAAQASRHWIDLVRDAPPAVRIDGDLAAVGPVRPHEFVGDTLDAATTRDLRALAASRRTTPFTITLSAFGAFVARHADVDDLVVSFPALGRPRRELEALIGCFVTTLPFRFTIGPDETFDSLVTRATNQLGASLTNQIARNLSDVGSTPSALLFSFTEDGELPAPDGCSVTLRTIRLGAGAAELALTARAVRDVTEIRLDYNPNAYSADLARDLLRRYTTFLRRLVATPDARLCTISLLPPAELHHVTHEWQPAPGRQPARAVIADVVDRCRERPDAIAVEDGEVVHTYRELDEQSEALAAALSARVGLGDVVAVVAPRSWEALVSMVAIARAGAAYLPIDPDYPEARVRLILEDAGARAALATDECRSLLADAPGIEIIDPSSAFGGARGRSEQLAKIEPDALAYVIYTSGSTGTPVGIEIEHASLRNLVEWHNDCYSVTASDRTMWFSSPGFDASVWETWPYLARGASISIVPPAARLNTDLLFDWLTSRRIDIGFIPTPMAMALARARGALPPTMRVLLTGGDALTPGAIPPGMPLVNHYGPTEVTVVSTAIDWREADAAGASTIGRPISNLRAYVLDRHQNPCGVLMPGELYLTGASVARGYRGEERRSAAFVEIDVGNGPERAFRTGDAVRWLRSGQLDFLGRLGGIVKVGGHRVSPTEVQDALHEHPAIRDAVVHLDGEPPQLHALVVLEHATTYPEIRSFLRGRLPAFMIPAQVNVVDQLAIGPHGKVDVRATRAEARPLPRGTVEMPRTPLERMLCEVWELVLDVAPIGISDNFFDLGGDSLAAIEVSTHVAERGFRLDSHLLYEHQSIDALAPAVRAGVAAEQGLVAGDAALVPIQRWLLDGVDVIDHAFAQSVVLRCDLDLSIADVRAAAVKLVEHHDALRLRFHRSPAGWQARHADPESSVSAHELPDGTTADAATTILAGQIDVGRGPAVALGIWRAGGDTHLAIAIHHLVVDALSWPFLVADLLSVLLGRCDALPRKTTSFARWASVLDARHVDAIADIDHWERVVAGAHSVSLAPAAPPAISELSLSSDDTRRLLEAHGRTDWHMLDVLVAALVCATPSDGSLLIELESSGRDEEFDEADPSRTVGWFTSLYPVLVPAAVDPACALTQVRAALREVPSHGWTYGALRFLHTDETVRDRLRYRDAHARVNYLGDMSRSLRPAMGIAVEHFGAAPPSAAATAAAVSLDAWVRGGALTCRISSPPGRIDETALLDALRALASEEPAHAVANLPLAADAAKVLARRQ